MREKYSIIAVALEASRAHSDMNTFATGQLGILVFGISSIDQMSDHFYRHLSLLIVLYDKQ